MAKAKLILTFLFVLTLSSGLVAGMLVSRVPVKTPVSAPSRSPLSEALKLTDDQNEKMRKIWEGVRNNVDDCFTQAQDVQKHRDEAVMKMLTPEQKVSYAKYQQDCSDSLSSLRNRRDTMFQEAVAETKKILTDPQKDKYEEILQHRLGQSGGRGNAGSPDWIPQH